MRIFVVKDSWIGGWMDFVIKGLEKNNYEVIQIAYVRQKSILRSFKLQNIIQVRDYLEKKSWHLFNENWGSHSTRSKE